MLRRDLSSDSHASFSVDSACDMCRRVADQVFNEVEDDQIVLDGPGTDALLLPEMPVKEVSEVVSNGVTLSSPDNYVLNGNGILIRQPSPLVWSRLRQSVSVTYTHGFATIPEDVRAVALQAAARLYAQGPAIFEALGSYSVRYNAPATDFSSGEKAILRKYRRAP